MNRAHPDGRWRADAWRIAEWRTASQQHAERADRLSASHRARKRRGESHPIEDFLWTYYSIKPSELRRWHPGAGVLLEHAGDEREAWRYYERIAPPGETASAASAAPAGTASADATTTDAARVDTVSFFARRGATVDYVDALLRRTLEHTPRFACFGLHEWAMVYRLTPEQLRHTRLPLRIGHDATDRVVETHQIGCTHFDAYRFFTPDAEPLNTLRPTRETQPDMEQAGCLHAGMDVYKWAGKLGPLVPGDLLLDCFELARDIREVDMRASPYDVSGYTGHTGELLTPIPIETPEGKRTYAHLQRGFADRGNALRMRVLAAIDTARADLRARAAPSERTGPSERPALDGRTDVAERNDVGERAPVGLRG